VKTCVRVPLVRDATPQRPALGPDHSEREPCRRGRREGRWGRDGLVRGDGVLERDDAVRSAGWSHVAEAARTQTTQRERAMSPRPARGPLGARWSGARRQSLGARRRRALGRLEPCRRGWRRGGLVRGTEMRPNPGPDELECAMPPMPARGPLEDSRRARGAAV